MKYVLKKKLDQPYEFMEIMEVSSLIQKYDYICKLLVKILL